MKKSLKKQMAFGYVTIVVMMMILLLSFLTYLYSIYHQYQIVTENRANQTKTQEAVAGHYQWLEGLSMSIQTGEAFSGSLDSKTCGLGVWVASIGERANLDSKISNTLQAINTVHDQIHVEGQEALALAKTDKAAAYQEYANTIKPQVLQVTDGLTVISNRYRELADNASSSLNTFILWAIGTGVVLAIIATVSAYLFANSITNKIFRPIAAVADWSKKLSMGIENLDFDGKDIEKHEHNEIGVMVKSFKGMADSIRDNVRVVKRVADGDMTAFVNIRSAEDSLGKHLYRMVQTNDLMFADILQVAQRVVEGSQQISRVSDALANNTSIQADAINQLSNRVDSAAELAGENANKAIVASDISNEIKVHIKSNSEKMELLVVSANEVQEASRKIATVIKAIDDIAFQTNILALNAAVEAARAGEAGKGFAVVANEVRSLALRSAQAASETKTLIEDTMIKAQAGSAISEETAETFQQIVNSVNSIIGMVMDISKASHTQQSEIEDVREGICQITQAATENAASSEESAASSQDMAHHAEVLRQEMSKFNLRKRHQGEAYIPPEKRNDPEFIKQANENYRLSLQRGKPTYMV